MICLAIGHDSAHLSQLSTHHTLTGHRNSALHKPHKMLPTCTSKGTVSTTSMRIVLAAESAPPPRSNAHLPMRILRLRSTARSTPHARHSVRRSSPPYTVYSSMRKPLPRLPDHVRSCGDTHGPPQGGSELTAFPRSPHSHAHHTRRCSPSYGSRRRRKPLPRLPPTRTRSTQASSLPHAFPTPHCSVGHSSPLLARTFASRRGYAAMPRDAICPAHKWSGGLHPIALHSPCSLTRLLALPFHPTLRPPFVVEGHAPFLGLPRHPTLRPRRSCGDGRRTCHRAV